MKGNQMMVMNDELGHLAIKNASTADLRAAARRAGMVTLDESGFKKVLQGLTSVEEVFRMTMAGD